MPFELITLLGSVIIGFLTALVGLRMKLAAQTQKHLMQAAGLQKEMWADAREYGLKDKGFAWTRRLIALMAVFAIILLPKLVAVWMPDINVTLGWTEWKPGFLFFTEGRNVIEWKVATGLVLTPLDTHLVSAIVGLYFGGSIMKNA
jgi:hypothetical protein|tara:strand:+ start:1080 stop:1517 length:438 start_codon:yes stop_codon:yes gene_type:complete